MIGISYYLSPMLNRFPSVTSARWPSVHHQHLITLSSIPVPRMSHIPKHLGRLFLTIPVISDLWVADSLCSSGCESVPTFDPSSSSSFQNESTAFTITYGSGQAAGSLGSDIVQMAGFSVKNQVFAVCNQVSPGLLTSPVSGLLGLAFQSISASKAEPLWQTLVSSGAWDSPLMAFQLTR